VTELRCLQAALEWVRRDVGIVPVVDVAPGVLTPRLKWQEDGPLLTEAQVRYHWVRYPADQLAIYLDNSRWAGPRLGCVDDDSGKHPPPPGTAIPRPIGGYSETTRSGGRHHPFSYDVELPPGFASRVTGLRGFVDVLAGGIVYVAPTVNAGRGEYHATVGLDAGIPRFPSIGQALEASAEWLHPAWLEAADGGRDPTGRPHSGNQDFSACYRLAVRAVAAGADDDQVREAVGCDHPEWSPQRIHRTTERIRHWLASRPPPPTYRPARRDLVTLSRRPRHRRVP
jgi:hypothetical protein